MATSSGNDLMTDSLWLHNGFLDVFRGFDDDLVRLHSDSMIFGGDFMVFSAGKIRSGPLPACSVDLRASLPAARYGDGWTDGTEWVGWNFGTSMELDMTRTWMFGCLH